MKTPGAVLLTYLYLIFPVHADTFGPNDLIIANTVDCNEQASYAISNEVIERRGCCSWHSGVCGCSGGRQTCCDGTLSPTCTCYKNSPIDLTINPVNVLAWDGSRTDTGGQIEVESYDHQGRGEGEVEYYDYESGEYRQGYLDMYPGGSGEIQDYDTGETFEVEMD